MAFSPTVKQEFAGTMARETALREHSGKKNSYVCSQHFEANCFIKPMGGQRIRLKPDSIPTKFIFTVKKPKRKKPTDRASLNTKKTEIEKLQEHSVSESINTEHTDLKSGSDGIETEHLESDHEGLVQTGDENWEHQLKLKDDEIACLLQTWQTKEHELNKKIQELENQLEEERRARKELELLIEKKAFSIETVKDNDKLLRFYTGFENYEVFSMVLDFLGRETAAHLDYQNTENLGEIKHKYKPGPSRVLSIENEFFLVLCHLKVGLLEEDLSARFGVCQSVVSQIVNTWIKFIFFRFKELDVFPSREIVQLHLPECFRTKYSTTTLIIDATEIYIEKPNNPEAQQVTFSSYKNSNTLKALVGIVPKGGISFVSTLFGSSISDKELTQKSGLIEKLNYGDAIMADRGFNIQEMLAFKGVKVNVPPFMNESGQFNESELLETRRIASLRIHVERAMERIKNYHILDFVPITLCRNGIIDMIFFVCATLSNFLPPLVDG